MPRQISYRWRLRELMAARGMFTVAELMPHLTERGITLSSSQVHFKYAMAMELDDPGFHHSVLTDFRDRLTEDDRADRLLDLAL